MSLHEPHVALLSRPYHPVRPTARRYNHLIHTEAQRLGVREASAFGGSHCRLAAIVRWRVWKSLHDQGHAYIAIASVCGFDYSSVRYGVRRIEAMEAIGDFCRDLGFMNLKCRVRVAMYLDLKPYPTPQP